jgi:hypothetical protein
MECESVFILVIPVTTRPREHPRATKEALFTDNVAYRELFYCAAKKKSQKFAQE